MTKYEIELKDLFAAHAMQAIITTKSGIEYGIVAIQAYEIAEKMLRARQNSRDTMMESYI